MDHQPQRLVRALWTLPPPFCRAGPRLGPPFRCGCWPQGALWMARVWLCGSAPDGKGCVQLVSVDLRQGPLWLGLPRGGLVIIRVSSWPTAPGSTPLPRPGDPPPSSLSHRGFLAVQPVLLAKGSWGHGPGLSQLRSPQSSQELSQPTRDTRALTASSVLNGASLECLNVFTVTVGPGTIPSTLNTLKVSTHIFDATAQQDRKY